MFRARISVQKQELSQLHPYHHLSGDVVGTYSEPCHSFNGTEAAAALTWQPFQLSVTPLTQMPEYYSRQPITAIPDRKSVSLAIFIPFPSSAATPGMVIGCPEFWSAGGILFPTFPADLNRSAEFPYPPPGDASDGRLEKLRTE